MRREGRGQGLLTCREIKGLKSCGSSLHPPWEMRNQYCKDGAGEGGGEMVRWLRAFAVLAQLPGSVTSTHMVAHNHLLLQF